MSEQPSLGGQFEAWVRQGAKDLHNAIVPAFPESQRGVDEQGTPTSPTSAMVTEDLKGIEPAAAPQPSYEAMLESYAAPSPVQQQEMER